MVLLHSIPNSSRPKPVKLACRPTARSKASNSTASISGRVVDLIWAILEPFSIEKLITREFSFNLMPSC